MADKQATKRAVDGAVRLEPFLKLVGSLEREKESLLGKISATSPDNALAVKRIHEIDSKLMSIQDAFTEGLVKRIGMEREGRS